MPARRIKWLSFGPSDSSYRNTQTFATINNNVETQKVVRRTLSVRGMGTIRAFYLATHFLPHRKSRRRLSRGGYPAILAAGAVTSWNLYSEIGGAGASAYPQKK